MASNVQERKSHPKLKGGLNPRNGSNGRSPPKPPASSGPASLHQQTPAKSDAQPRNDVWKRPPGQPVNAWTSNQHEQGSIAIRAQGGAGPASQPPISAEQVQLLTRGNPHPPGMSDNERPGISHPTPHRDDNAGRIKKDSMKRKPALKNMSIGDMIPSRTFPPKKGKPPRESRESRRDATHGGSSASSAANRSVTRSLHALSETPAGLDLADFPALLPVAPSSSGTRDNAKVKKPPPHVATRSALSPTAPEFHLQNPINLPKQSSQPRKPKAAAPAPTAATTPAAVATLEPKPRDADVSGDEHVLLRLMREGKFVVQTKGRQRIRPRRKKFSALKKKVLHERLTRWRELHPLTGTGEGVENESDRETLGDSRAATTVCLHGFVEPEELEDDDEYDEIITNLRDMAVKVGPLKRVYVPRTVEAERVATFVEFAEAKDAAAAAACWTGLSLGGQVLQVTLKPEASADLSEHVWQTWCLAEESRTGNEAERPALTDDGAWEVVIDNALTEDDMEDDDCLAESVADVKSVAQRFGPVASVRVEKGPRWKVYLQYEGGRSVAQAAAAEFRSVTMGGQTLNASVVNNGPPLDDACVYVILENVLSEEDIEDPDCLQESLADVRELAQRYGDVKDVTCEGPDGKLVRVSYAGDQSVANFAAEAFNAMTIGGVSVTASVHGGYAQHEESQVPSGSEVPASGKSSRQEPPGPMLSGDKRIPEQFAECLRVPKVPNTGQPRKYATLVENDTVKPLLVEMLAELARLQKRAMEEKNAKARRRLVIGLREVARGIRAHKVKMVVMANNLDDYGAIDEKLQEIIDLAFEEGVPVFYEFSKRTLGKAVGKSIRVGVVGVQSPEGAHQQFKKLLALAPK